MKLRNKLLLPALAALFASFFFFVIFEIMNQGKKGRIELDEKIANLTALVATTNVSYVWNLDEAGLSQSLDSFIKDREIVRIEIMDAAGNSLAKVEEKGLPNLIEKEADITHEGATIGTAKIAFTDAFIRADARKLVVEVTILEAIIFGIMSVLMIFISRLITVPVLHLTYIVKDMAEGEGNLAVEIPVHGDDEVAHLSGHFNTFIHKLKSIVVNLKSVGIKSKTLGDDLSAHSQNISSSSIEIAASMHSMSQRTISLHEEISRSSENVIQINAFIERVVEMIQNQAAAINESSAAIEQMIANVATIERSTENKIELIHGLERLAKELEEGMGKNVAAIEKTANSTAIISEMIMVINQVASQTNLLAMNAAIEAAHAGDYGRGFSVVADEIRKLAEQTASNSKSISSSLKEIISGMAEATSLTKESSETIGKVIVGISDVAGGMDETMSGLKEISIGNRQITESLGELNKMTEAVKSSGAEMREGTGRIESSFKKITEVVEENRTGIEGMADGIKEISNSMSRLAELSNENSMNIQTLDEEIAKFKTE